MAEGNGQESKTPDMAGIQVCVRVRPLNQRERDEGYRNCVMFDDATKQVVLTAVDKATLMQLRGKAATGYAFDRRYGSEHTSDSIYGDCVANLVDHLFRGYNATVLAYGQTGSGKTHTMSGGVGIYGVYEQGITRRVASHVFSLVDQLKKQMKPGEAISVHAHALELYNEELRDLSIPPSGRDSSNRPGFGSGSQKDGTTGPFPGTSGASVGELKIVERTGKDGKVLTEVMGVNEIRVETADQLIAFFTKCFEQRAVSSTKLNDASSRSHAIYSLHLHRTICDIGDGKVRTIQMESKFHLVDLAGSERVKRSGVTGKEFKEATFINTGLLALGNVIVALSHAQEGEKRHVPYRDSRLTRLLQDSLGGSSLTVLISCISASESDFEETGNTLKYANRACRIKNTPLPNKFVTLEEDLLPMLPANNGGIFNMVQVQQLLEEHSRMRDAKERREAERREKEVQRAQELRNIRECDKQKPGYQRLRILQYDDMRRKLVSSHGTKLGKGELVADGCLQGFRSSKHDSDGLEAPRPPRAVSPDMAMRGRRHTAGDVPDPTRPLSCPPPRAYGEHPRCIPESEVADNGVTSMAAANAMARGRLSIDTELDDGSASAAAFKNKFRRPGGKVMSVDEGMQTSPVGDDAEGIRSYDPGRREEAAAVYEEVGSVSDPAYQVLAFNLQSSEAGIKAEALSSSSSGSGESKPQPAKLLARFKVNAYDTLAVFMATTAEDFLDVASLLPPNTALPAADKMTYLIARLEVSPFTPLELRDVLERVAAGTISMTAGVGPAVGCLMTTLGTNLIADCIFDFDDPEDVEGCTQEQRLELWGLQIPHNPVRPALISDDHERESTASPGPSADSLRCLSSSPIPATPTSQAGSSGRPGCSYAEEGGSWQQPGQQAWSSADRLNVSVGLLHALCNAAQDAGAVAGFCVPRPQLLRRWLQAGVRMKQVSTPTKLIYPQTAHDYAYYKGSTVAYFKVDEVRESLSKVLSIVES